MKTQTWGVGRICAFFPREKPCSLHTGPTGLSSQFSFNWFFLKTSSFRSPTDHTLSPQGAGSLGWVCSCPDGAEREQMSMRVCQGQGRAGGGEGGPQGAVRSGSKTEPASCRRPYLAGKSANRPRNSQTNRCLMESILRAALPSCKKGFMCPFL